MQTPVSIVATDIAGVPEESSAPAVSWGPIIGGALTASAVTLLLMFLGSGLGLTMVSPWSNEGVSLTTFAVSTAVWLVIMQWVSAALGGYLAGRLRTKWVGVHTDEVYFRDTAHGFLAWALATVLLAGVLGSALSGAVGAGVGAAANVASGAASGATEAAANATDPTAYFVDTLFRPADPRAAAPATDEGAAAAQASRILLASATTGTVSDEDRTYLGQLVAARTGLAEPEATARVDAVLARVDAARAEAKQAADDARKASATFALIGALSLLIGAFIASVAAALGGRQRDDDEVLYVQ
jgi:hypothetical protein